MAKGGRSVGSRLAGRVESLGILYRALAETGSGDAVELHGYDAGVSFRSVHDPASGTTQTVISNTGKGTWPIEALLDELPAT